MRYDDSAYMFSSARIRAMETHMLSAEACERFVSARSSDEIMASLGEFGCRTVKREDADGEKLDREASLMTLLEDAFAEITSMLPTPDTVKYLQYKYDCNNIKALLKCRIRGVAPDSMLSRAGSVPLERLIAAVDNADYSCLPKHMAEAAENVSKSSLKTADTQSIDLILDRACFADMAQGAEKCGVPFARRYVSALIDLTNLQMTLRVIRMGGERAEQLLEAALLAGGSISEDKWRALRGEGEEAVWQFVGRGDYAPVTRLFRPGDPLSTLERATDAYMMTLVREVRWLPFGAELAIAYLVGLEVGIKNLRIIMAGKDAHKDASVIRERLRDMYV